jgi:hypothetical protein
LQIYVYYHLSSIYHRHCNWRNAEVSTLDKIHARKAGLCPTILCGQKMVKNTTLAIDYTLWKQNKNKCSLCQEHLKLIVSIYLYCFLISSALQGWLLSPSQREQWPDPSPSLSVHQRCYIQIARSHIRQALSWATQMEKKLVDWI